MPCGGQGRRPRRRTGPARGPAVPSTPARRRCTSSPVSAEAHGTRGAACSRRGRLLPEPGQRPGPSGGSGTRGPPAAAGSARPWPANCSATCVHRVGVAGDHHRGRAVHRRDPTPPATPSSAAVTSASVAATAVIAPPPGSACISRAPGRHQRARILQGQHPGRVRGGDLARPNARHRVRGDPAGGQQRDQPGLHREQARLREHRLIRPGRPGRRSAPVPDGTDLGHRHPEAGFQQRRTPGRTPPRTPGRPRASSAPIPARWLP